MEQLHKDGEKSVGIRHFNDYNIIVLPTTKKRTFLLPDYSKMVREG